MEPTFSGLLFTFACVGFYAFVSTVFTSSAESKPRRLPSYNGLGSVHSPGPARSSGNQFKLEVDITGRGDWREQARGQQKDLKQEAAVIRRREAMATRIVPI